MRKLSERSGPLARIALSILMLQRPREDLGTPPVVIGGQGGSGTRAVAALLRRAGWSMGEWIGPDTLDSIPLIFFEQRWFRRLFHFPEVRPSTARTARRQLLRAAELHRGGAVGEHERWGWKHAMSSWFIPFHTAVYPELRFIHLIRDGRDMALTRPHYLTRVERGFLDLDPGDLIASQLQIWTRGHNRAADDGTRCCQPGHYLELRYEDLCEQPGEVVRELYRFVDAPTEGLSDAIAAVMPSSGIGRWRSQEDAIIARAEPSFWATMARFGYL